MSIPYSNAGRTVNIHKIKGMNYHELKTNELCTKNTDGVMEGVNVFATSGNLTTTGAISAGTITGGQTTVSSLSTNLAVLGSGQGYGGIYGGIAVVQSLDVRNPTYSPTDPLSYGYITGGVTSVTSLTSSGAISGGDTNVTSLTTLLPSSDPLTLNYGPITAGEITGGDTTVTSLSTAMPGMYGWYGPITTGVLSIDDRIQITSSITQPWISKIHNLTFKAWTKADGTEAGEAGEAGTTTGTNAETFKISSYNDGNQFVQYQCKGRPWFNAYPGDNVQFSGHRYNCFYNGYGASLHGGQYGTNNTDYFTISMGPNDNYPQLRFMHERWGAFSTLVAGTWYYHSDDRLKHNEQVISNALSTIRLLSPQTYDKSNTLTDASNTYVDAGFIAQEVAQIPELAHYVHTGTDTEIWHLNYTPLFTYAVAGLKELDAIVQSQQTKIDSLEARLTALENRN